MSDTLETVRQEQRCFLCERRITHHKSLAVLRGHSGEMKRLCVSCGEHAQREWPLSLANDGAITQASVIINAMEDQVARFDEDLSTLSEGAKQLVNHYAPNGGLSLAQRRHLIAAFRSMQLRIVTGGAQWRKP